MCEQMINVKSSNIESVGYDENLKIVYVKFLNGSIYTYKGVSNSEFNNLKNAVSVGSYLNRNFKDIYPYERIS